MFILRIFCIRSFCNLGFLILLDFLLQEFLYIRTFTSRTFKIGLFSVLFFMLGLYTWNRRMLSHETLIRLNALFSALVMVYTLKSFVNLQLQ